MERIREGKVAANLCWENRWKWNWNVVFSRNHPVKLLFLHFSSTQNGSIIQAKQTQLGGIFKKTSDEPPMVVGQATYLADLHLLRSGNQPTISTSTRAERQIVVEKLHFLLAPSNSSNGWKEFSRRFVNENSKVASASCTAPPISFWIHQQEQLAPAKQRICREEEWALIEYNFITAICYPLTPESFLTQGLFNVSDTWMNFSSLSSKSIFYSDRWSNTIDLPLHGGIMERKRKIHLNILNSLKNMSSVSAWVTEMTNANCLFVCSVVKSIQLSPRVKTWGPARPYSCTIYRLSSPLLFPSHSLHLPSPVRGISRSWYYLCVQNRSFSVAYISSTFICIATFISF